MNAKQKAEKLAQERGYTLEIDDAGRAFVVQIIAPNGHNFGGWHETPVGFPGPRNDVWKMVCNAIPDLTTIKCGPDTCGGWMEESCEYWSSVVTA